MKKRIICLFLVLTMTFTLLPERFYDCFAGLVSAEEEKSENAEAEDEVSMYLVTNGGVISDTYVKKDTVKKGKEVILPTEEQISRDGYIFDGWYSNSDFEGDAVTKATAQDEELNFYAKWIARYYTITIPDTVQLDESGEMGISADCHGFYENDVIEVGVSSENQWKLEKEGSSVNYNILNENGKTVKNDETVAEFTKTGKTKLKYNVDGNAENINEAGDTITFKVNLITTQYTVTFDTKGGSEIAPAKYDAGTLLMDLPAAEKEGYMFISWCLDESCTDFVEKTDELTKDIKIYAYYLEVSEVNLEDNTWCAHAYNMDTDYSIKLKTSKSMTAAQVLAGITVVNATEPDLKDFYEVTGSGKDFVIKGTNGFRAGSTYKVTINDENIEFAEYADTANPPSELDFSIYKAETVNMGLKSDIKYIPLNDLSDLTLNGKKVDEINISSIQVNTDSEYASEKSIGNFTYKGNIQLKVGDIVGIYKGNKPTGSKAETILSDPLVSFVEVTGKENNIIFYRGADTEDVLFTPDVFPIPESADKDGNSNNLSAKISEEYFIYTDGSMSILGLGVDTTVDVGDYVAFYTGTLNKTNGKGITVTKYALITSVKQSSQQDGVYYTIEFEQVTYDEMCKSMDTYYSREVNEEEYEELVDDEAVKSAIYESAQDEEFLDTVEDYLTTTLIVSDEFNDKLEEKGIDKDKITIVQSDEFNVEEYTKEQLAGDPMVEVSIGLIQPYISKQLQYFEGKDGLRVTLKVSVEVTVHAGQSTDLKFTITTELQQEIRISITADAEAEWDNFGPIPYICDYKVSMSTDLYEYTGLGLEISVTTEEADEEVGGTFAILKKVTDAAEDFKEKMEAISESIGKITGSEDDEALMSTLPEKYAEMIEAAGELDWVDVFEVNIMKAHFTLLYIIDLSIGVDVVFSFKMNVTVGIEFYYAAAKRFIFNLSVFDHTVTNETTDLEPEVYQFTFYAMGTIGIRAGVQLKLEIGLFSTEMDSIGLTARVGVFVEMYGYFYYVYKNTKMNGVKETVSNYSGALYFEIGLFIRITFNAQIGSGALEYELELLDKQWPLVTFGEQKNVIDFSWEQDDLTELDMKYSITRAYLPDDVFEVEYLDLKEGADSVTIDGEEEVVFFKETYDYSDFDIVITDSRFQYDHELNRITVTPNEGDRYIDGEMIITYKAALTISKNPIQRRIKLHWDDLASGYIITFESQGGSYVGIIEGRYGMDITSPQDPVRTGYTFTGWYKEPECKTKTEVPKTMPSGNLTLYAGWNSAEVSYKIEYYQENLNGTYELVDYSIKKAKTGAVVKPEQKKYEGFITPEIQELKITADGAAVTKYYYQRNTYEITFEAGNSNNDVYTKSYKYGATIVVPSFGMVGYEFNGWNKEIPETMPAYNITVKGSWAVSTDTEYSIRYYLQNAEGEGYTLSYVLYQKGTTGATVFAPIVSFEGYTPENETSGGEILPDGSLVLDVYYRRNTYTVTYETNGGSELENQEYRFGAEVYSERTQKTDYAFVGWYTDKDLTRVFDGKMPTSNITLYAAWELGTGYTVYHHWMDENGNYAQSTADVEYKYVQEEEIGRQITVPTKTAEGFETVSAQTVSISTDPSNPTEVHYYYPRKSFTLYVNYNDGTSATEKSLYYGAAITLNTVRDGYTFAGWYSNSGLTTQAEAPKTMPLNNVTLYAKWTANTYKIEYIVNGGKLDSSVSYDTYSYGASVSSPRTPTRDGYTFGGWYTDKDLKTAYSKPSTMPSHNITLYAKWNVITYKIEYSLDGGTNDSKNKTTYNIESGVITIYQPTKTNYEFTGWTVTRSLDGKTYSDYAVTNKLNPSLPSGTIGYFKFTANYQGVECKIAFNLDATEYVSATPGNVTVRYNNKPANITSLPTRSGYTFKGFYTGSNGSGTMVYDSAGNCKVNNWTTTSDTTLHAYWETKTYTIKYESADGNVRTGLTTQTVKFSDATVTMGDTSTITLCNYKLGQQGSIEVRYKLIGFSTKSTGIDVDYDAGKAYTNNINNEYFYDTITLYEVSFVIDFTAEMADTWSALETKGGIPVDDEEDESDVYFYFNTSGSNSLSYRKNGSAGDSSNFTSAWLKLYQTLPARDKTVMQKYTKTATSKFSFELTHIYDFDPDITIYSINNSGTLTEKWSDDISKCSKDKSVTQSEVGNITFSWTQGTMDLAGFKIHFESSGSSDDTYLVESCRLYMSFTR